MRRNSCVEGFPPGLRHPIASNFLRNITRRFSLRLRRQESRLQVSCICSDLEPVYDQSIHHGPSVRGLYPLEARPGLISLLAGKPNATTFPLTSIQLTARSPTEPGKEITTELNGQVLAEGLQYGPTAGIPSLIDWFYGLQENAHGRKKGEGWRISVGSGSQDVIYKVCSGIAE